MVTSVVDLGCIMYHWLLTLVADAYAFGAYVQAA